MYAFVSLFEHSEELGMTYNAVTAFASDSSPPRNNFHRMFFFRSLKGLFLSAKFSAHKFSVNTILDNTFQMQKFSGPQASKSK